ncbi:hypothetical protein [Microbacterium lacusdiani]|jgi:hypothetical protein
MTKPVVLLAALAAVAYAAVGILSITVWEPMAAMPGLSHDEIVAGIAAGGESHGAGVAAAVLCLASGAVAAVALAALASAGRVRPLTATVWILGIIALGPIAYFSASFPMGMAVGDAFLIGGGSHQPVPFVLAGVSALAVALVVILSVADARGRRAATAPVTD